MSLKRAFDLKTGSNTAQSRGHKSRKSAGLFLCLEFFDLSLVGDCKHSRRNKILRTAKICLSKVAKEVVAHMLPLKNLNLIYRK